ncbi:MAG: transposase [Bacteroidales bacterium]|nr:transposase [Bacteroidales bacterium]
MYEKCVNCCEHQQVNHSEKFFGNEDGYTTNHIEGFWGVFRRGVIGTYHYMSKKYLHRYVDEVVFRFNNKDYAIGAVAQGLLEKAIGNVTYSMVKQMKMVA